MVENKILIVEGNEDMKTIAELMGKHIEWPENKEDAPVNIINPKDENIEGILKNGFISGHIKSSKVDIMLVGFVSRYFCYCPEAYIMSVK